MIEVYIGTTIVCLISWAILEYEDIVTGKQIGRAHV